MSTKFYLSTSIAYASKMPHVGNDYEIIFSDTIARYKRMTGHDVFFLTGTDDHGQKIQDLAAAKGIAPKEYVDEVTSQIRDNYRVLNISYDKFIRTTDDFHEKSVAAIFKRLYEQGDIYKGKYEGSYCVPCESFYTASQLVGGKCPDCGGDVSDAKEEAYFFKADRYQERLVKHIEENPDFISPELRKKEMLNNFILPGVQDFCVSRSTFTWGVPVEFDPGHVVYVWIDALSNYITALGYNPEEPASDLFVKNWPCDVHIIGKDIVRFHTIYWPCMLMALNLPLPKKVFGHPWMLFNDEKMSKSKGNTLYSKDLAAPYGTDALRFVALSMMPFAQDGNITTEKFIGKYNAALANSIGNLVTRTVAMTNKYFDGIIPIPSKPDELDEDLKSVAVDTYKNYIAAMDEFRTLDAIDAIMELAHRSNKYIDQTMPWVLAKNPEDSERLGTVLYNLLEAIRYLAVLLSPITPVASEVILGQIGTDIADIGSLVSFGALRSGAKTGEAVPLFARIEEEKKPAATEKKPSKKQEKPVQKPAEPPKDGEITYDAFMQTELRVALVEECTIVENSDKLLLLTLDVGTEKRQVVSGIAKFYSPADIIGKKVILVYNLKPAKLRGIMSQGMILASGDDPIKVIFAHQDAIPGDRVR